MHVVLLQQLRCINSAVARGAGNDSAGLPVDPKISIEEGSYDIVKTTRHE